MMHYSERKIIAMANTTHPYENDINIKILRYIRRRFDGNSSEN